MTLQERIKEAQEMRTAYIKAELAVLKGQSYNIGGQSLTRANLSEITKARKEWEKRLSFLRKEAQIIRRVIPMDN